MELRRVGVWARFDRQPAEAVRQAVAELEDLGYGSVWVGESVGREAFSQAALLLSWTRRLVIGLGVAQIWARDAMAMLAGQATLAEAHPDRFLLGLGVSHRRTVEEARGHAYTRPLEAMRDYLDGMDRAADIYRAVPPPTRPPRLLAALGPRMLALARERADGAHTYLVPPEHTAQAREILAPQSRLLIPEQAVVLETDPHAARRIARQHVAFYLGLPNYVNNLRRLGFTEDDVADGGSDRLVDAIVAWGGVDAIVQRVRAHLDAGADHVAVQVLTADEKELPRREWRELAPALVSIG